jgi:trehalose/maltose hydrolase-like predicted phosphorylase
MADWRGVAERLVTGLNQRTGLIEQFAGYFDLEDIDLRQYSGRTVPMDVVLGRERVQASQVIKQADVVMLLALLPDAWDSEVQRTNFAYYEPRCGHGSSLSRAMHAIMAARLGQTELAEQYFRETAATDSADNAAGLSGGVHIAGLGGLWQTTVFGFGGFAPHLSGVSFAPHLPASWRRLQYRVQWRGRLLQVDIDGIRESLTVCLEHGEPMDVSVGAETHGMQLGEPWRVRIPDT